MPAAFPPLLPAAADDVAATLLVLLPRPAPAFPAAAQAELRARLGPAVRVLCLNAADHPAVVRSLASGPLPACVLLHQGIELWQQSGLPTPAELTALVLARLGRPT
ncbi:hypothetical protein [Hymenobacter psychrophilus]|uniref:Thioredoxin n=1 Tax=Hymenobacter psychrophilus TaxID=651662 RepID=A0A1H3K6W6_9BACT|nr:hypothetical protein [Hymenobacter psychrophilus]SDY47903.1 hypothetical protein SAMN04488069_10923 [Hymenobacter psychrophilus]